MTNEKESEKRIDNENQFRHRNRFDQQTKTERGW